VPYADIHDPQTLNLYQFVGGNPASKADPDGHEGPGSYEGMVAMANSIGDRFAEDFNAIKNAMSGPELPHGQTPALENMRQQLQQCPCPANQKQEDSKQNNNNNSKSQDTNGEKSGSSNKNGMAPKEGETGGPGAGKRIAPKTQREALKENQAANGGQAKCVFCKEKVGEGTGNKINFDHAKAKAGNPPGNNSLNNTNVTCEYCNKSKGTGDAPKNPKHLEQN
jgi:hypothetical protein